MRGTLHASAGQPSSKAAHTAKHPAPCPQPGSLCSAAARSTYSYFRMGAAV